MRTSLRYTTLLALSATAFTGLATAQYNGNRPVMNRPVAGQIQANKGAIAQGAVNAPVYGPGVIDVTRALVNGGTRIQPDWEIGKVPRLNAAIRWMEPAQQQGFMSANGISPMGGGGFADLAQAYNGPAGTVGLWTRCASSSGRRLDGKMFAYLYKGNCTTGQPELEINYQPSKGSGGVLLDCAFKAEAVTSLVAIVKGRDEKGTFSILLGKTVQSFPPNTGASMPIAIKKSPGSDGPVMVKIGIAEDSADGFIDLYGCTVTPLA